jgi:hypothetical protein
MLDIWPDLCEVTATVQELFISPMEDINTSLVIH